MLHQLQVHRQILFDLTNLYLSPLKGAYERLAYLAGLRDPTTGVYAHPALNAQYPQERVSEALQHSHEEVFERLLESPLSVLEQDLSRYLELFSSREGMGEEERAKQMESWIPVQAPDYLKQLYCSNQAALCALLKTNKSKAR